MATERRSKIMQESLLFDIVCLMNADEEERAALLQHMYARAQSGMTVEEIALVKERAAMAKGTFNR